MQIRVFPVGVVKAFTGARLLDLPEGADGNGLLETLGLPSKLKIMLFVNGCKAASDRALTDGDEIKLVSSLGGG